LSVQGLADLVLQDPTLAGAMVDARDGAVPALDLTAPGAIRPFVVKGLVDAGRTVLAVTATTREAEDLVRALEGIVDPATVAYYPAW
jgi:transcription-repair coupling factor (superfamily II helicase)